MAKSKSPKAKSSSATIGFEQQIWDAACELWGHIPKILFSTTCIQHKSSTSSWQIRPST